MIDDECCKVCGREAPKGSPAYEFMICKLKELLRSLDSTTTDTSIEQSIFPHDFITGLYRQSIELGTKRLIQLSDIQNTILSNAKKKSEIDEIQSIISEKKDEKVEAVSLVSLSFSAPYMITNLEVEVHCGGR
jgi:DNA sulfur modification protein DndD